MKKKNFLMLALAAVAFAACSNEDLVPVDNPGNNNDLVTDECRRMGGISSKDSGTNSWIT